MEYLVNIVVTAKNVKFPELKYKNKKLRGVYIGIKGTRRETIERTCTAQVLENMRSKDENIRIEVSKIEIHPFELDFVTNTLEKQKS